MAHMEASTRITACQALEANQDARDQMMGASHRVSFVIATTATGTSHASSLPMPTIASRKRPNRIHFGEGSDNLSLSVMILVLIC